MLSKLDQFPYIKLPLEKTDVSYANFGPQV